MDFKNWIRKEIEIDEINFKDLGKGVAAGALMGGLAVGAGHSLRDKSQPDYPLQSPAKTLVEPEGEKKDIPHLELDKFKKEKPVHVSPKEDINEIDKYFDYIRKNEGYRTRVYDDGRGNATIGVGHLLTNNSQEIFRNLFGNEVNFNDIRSGRSSLTNEQVLKLFEYDTKKHLARAKRNFPKFESYPFYLRVALLDSVFRGDTGPKTTSLINQDKWEEAAEEYLNRYDYKNRQKLGIPGIGTRMERNRDAMLRYAREIKQF